MDLILGLALATFVLVIAFLVWNRISTKRVHESGGSATGVGGPSDPIAGNTPGIRPAEAVRESLDQAAAAPNKTPTKY